MSDEIEVREREEIVVPGVGEVVDSTDVAGCARALDALRRLEEDMRYAKRVLTDAIVAEAARQGVSKITLPDRLEAQVIKGTRTTYDAEALEARLREAGMPESRIREIVREDVTRTVVAVEAKRAARANPEYAEIIESTRTTFEGAPSVQIRSR